MNTKPLVVSLGILVSPQSAGHPFIYNKAVKEAVEALGWEHWAAVQQIDPALPMIHDLPERWTPCLVTLQYERIAPLAPLPRLLAMRRAIVATADSVVRYIKTTVVPEQQRTQRPIIYFVDFFTVSHLFPLALAMSQVPRRNSSLWLVYRMDVARRRTAPLYRWVTRYLRWILPRAGLVTLTDSELLRLSISRMLHTTVRTLPIPHATGWDQANLSTPEPIREAKTRRLTVGWLPGIARPDKGLETVRRLAQQTTEEAATFALAVSASADLQPVPNGCATLAVKNELTQQEYGSWLSSCDFVLLPYLAHEYAERTSGPFVEAIVAGKPPLVTDNTWMAYELHRYNLSELIMDYDHVGDVFARIRAVLADTTVRDKLLQMQQAYARTHSVENFGAEFQNVYIETQAKDTQ